MSKNISIKDVLAVVDGTPASLTGVDQAVAYAGLYDATLAIVVVTENLAWAAAADPMAYAEAMEASEAQRKEHVAAVRERHDDLARHRRLLWEDGQPFAQAVTEALRMVGFTVSSDPLEPMVVESEGVAAFVELESDRDQVVEWPYVRLQRRLEEHLLKQGSALKGIVIANGFREKDPDQRAGELSEPLRIACENYRYALVTTRTLFEVVKRVLGGADEAALLGLRRRLMSGSGLLTLELLLGEASEQTTDAGPIF